MEVAGTVEFSQAARTLTRAARRTGLVAPSFRSPPGIIGSSRTIRRRGGGAVVAIRLRGRPMVAVLADMIEGVIVANQLSPPQADQARTELWDALGFAAHHEAAPIAGAA